jgi:hypothetical protein
MYKEISVHSAAAMIARQKVQDRIWTSDQAIQFTELLDNLVKTGQLPNDPQLLGLLDQGGWKVVTSTGTQVCDGFELSV